uniref:tautomerase family protein n=1 Tax=Marinobacterium profundum TaxID=1714300 RepID=UPI000B2A580A|nr:hypothetical protein [Marinobacterium profundum]
MPTIRIQAIAPIGRSIDTLLTDCTAAAAKALGIPQDWCWALFQPVPPGSYAEGGQVWGEADASRATALISITALEGRTAALKAAVLAATAHAAAACLDLPLAQVFVEYRDIPQGQAFSGGEVV